MGLELDKEHVMSLKYQASEKIHDILKTNIRAMRRKCRRCGADLEWNFRFNVCDKCFER
jgi:ATP-dependent RNA helicase SUPV3L1/SUV3